MINTLKLRHETISNAIGALEKIGREYYRINCTKAFEELDNKIQLKILGKTITVPYFKTIYGNCINEDEFKAKRGMISKKYDSYNYESLSEDEVYNIIVNAFDDSSLCE